MNTLDTQLFLTLLEPNKGARAAEKLVVNRLPAWQEILSTARRHCVIPLISEGLKKAKISTPSGLAQFLKRFERSNTFANFRAAAALHKILEAMSAHDIRAYPYKGPYLASLAYGDLSQRVFGDLDLIVPPNQVMEASKVLQELGFEPCFPWVSPKPFLSLHYEYRFKNRHSAQVLELKWRTSPARFGAWGELGEDWKWSTPPELQGLRCFGPELEELFVILVIHGTKHLWSRLQWLCDLGRLLDSKALRWDQILVHAEKRQATRALALAAKLLENNLRAALPSELNFETPELSTVAARIQQSWFETGGIPNEEARVLLLRLTDSKRLGTVYTLRAILSPGPSEILAVPFELPWHGLYYLVRPIRYLAKWLGLDILQDPRETPNASISEKAACSTAHESQLSPSSDPN